MNKRIFKNLSRLMLAVTVLLIFSEKSFAELSASQTYTVVIPEITNIKLSSTSNDFGQIDASDYGVSNKSSHVITLGDGTNSNSYVQTNSSSKIGNKKFNLAFNGNDTQVKLTSEGNVIKLTLSKNDETSVDILLTDASQSAAPKLGNSGVDFVYQNDNNIAIPASSNVQFSDGIAGLNMKMDLDESSLNYSTKPNNLSFDVVFSILETD